MALVPQGNISRTVIAGLSGDPLGNVCVYLYPVGNSSSASYATCTLTNGTYQLSGVTAGSYGVAFSAASGDYLAQWYDGVACGTLSQSGATAVTVPAGSKTAAGINASMALVPRGNIAGIVTSASTGEPLGNICVYLYPVPGGPVGLSGSAVDPSGSAVDPSAVAMYATCTFPEGTYQLSAVIAGNPFDVAFADPSGNYVTQWYNGTTAGASSQSGATTVMVPAGNPTISGINAAMVAVSP